MNASALPHAAPAVALPRPSSPPVLLRLRTDEQLLAHFRAGNDEAFGVLHDRYRTRLEAYARSMLKGGGAEDAVQDVFIRAYRALRADDRPVAVRAWLYRVAHNRCIDELRRPAPAPSELVELADDAGGHDPGTLVERREHLRRLVEDLQRLPDQQRSALLMRELEGLSYQELAGALGVTLPAVKSLLVRARMGLAEAAEARDAACADIRADLAAALDRGVRMNARARRHLRDCEDCRAYREGLRQQSRAVAALAPPHGVLAALAGLLGGGAAGSGLLGGGGGGTAAGVAGGGVAAASATKVAAVVCCVAVTGGAAAQIERQVAAPAAPRPAPAHRPAPAAAASGPAPAPVVAGTAPAEPRTVPADPVATAGEPADAPTAPAATTEATPTTPDAAATPTTTTTATATAPVTGATTVSTGPAPGAAAPASVPAATTPPATGTATAAGTQTAAVRTTP